MSRKRKAEDHEAKNELGPAPSSFPKLARSDPAIGTYKQQSKKYKATPSSQPVEVDHMTPDTLHQALGDSRKKGDGAGLSRRLPAAAMNKLQHRRKLTTGSGKEVEHHRAYLLYAHHGLVPFTGPMDNPQDHYAAAMEVELRSSTTPGTLFGTPTIHDPRVFTGPSQQGVVPKRDAEWGLDRQLEMTQRVRETGHITSAHEVHLQDVVTEQRAALADMYKKYNNS